MASKLEMVAGPAGSFHDSIMGDVRVLWDGLKTWSVHTREGGSCWTPHGSKINNEANAITLALKVARKRYKRAA